VTLRALICVLSHLATGRRLGFGLICPEARYVGVLADGAARIDRRHAPVGLWQELDAAITDGLPSTPLERTSPVVRALLDDGRADVVVQVLSTIPIENKTHPVETLDALLRGTATRPELKLRQRSGGSDVQSN
jgi:hypothetical protein